MENALDGLKYLGLVLVILIFLYVGARLISSAVFRSWYEWKLKLQRKKDSTKEV